MAIAQNSSDRGMKSVGAEQKDGSLFVIPMGRINLVTGTGAPVGGDAQASPKGSIYGAGGAGKADIKTSASGASSTWVVIGSQS